MPHFVCYCKGILWLLHRIGRKDHAYLVALLPREYYLAFHLSLQLAISFYKHVAGDLGIFGNSSAIGCSARCSNQNTDHTFHFARIGTHSYVTYQQNMLFTHYL